jgi:ketosteroid isomerase-like protein
MEWVVLDMLPDPGPFRGREGTRRFWEMWADAFDEFHAELEEYVDAGETVIVITRMVGRGKDSREGALEAVGLPPDTPFRHF